MSYSVKEIFYTMQGEGANAGRPAVFCRFSGCNLWSGREKDREHAVCRFCDTDFVGTDGPGGGKFSDAASLARAVAAKWPEDSQEGRFVVCTGGEPLLQMDSTLIDHFHQSGFEIDVETNGKVLPPSGIDWICVSPKANSELILKHGHELKLVFPQIGGEPEKYADTQFEHYYIQPMDGPERVANTELAIKYCLQNPRWKLSLQTHKMIGIP